MDVVAFFKRNPRKEAAVQIFYNLKRKRMKYIIRNSK